MEIPLPEIDQPTLEKITAAANDQIRIEKELEALEEKEKELNRQLAEIAGGWDGESQHLIEGRIPSLMAEAGVEELTLTGGMEVQVKKELKCPSMAANSDMREPVLNWAEKSGNAGVIKDLITIPFDKGDKRVTAIIDFMTELKIQFERFRSIHPSTLKALFNEILRNPEKNDPLPISELGIQQFQRSKISFPKPKVNK